MDSLEIKNITIPYEDFKEMLEKVCVYENFIRDLEYIIRDSELDYYKKELDLKAEIEVFAKKYCYNQYICKLACLQRDLEKKEMESEK